MWCGCLEPCAASVTRWLTESSAANERRHVLKGLTATLSMAAAGCATTPDPKNAMTTPDLKSAATALLDETISIDIHGHPGMVRTLARAIMDGYIERLAAGRVHGSRPREPAPASTGRTRYRSPCESPQILWHERKPGSL